MKNKKLITLLSGAVLLSQLAAFPIAAQEDESEEVTTEESVSEEVTEESEAVETETESEATEEAEPTDLFAIGENNPFTEEELTEKIVLLKDVPEENLYSYEEVSTISNDLILAMRDAAANGEKITLEQFNEFVGENVATEVSETGSSEFHRYIAAEPLNVTTLTIQFYDEGNGMELANLEIEHHIPSNYEPLDITEEEVVELSSVDGFDSQLVERLGLPVLQQFVHLSDGVVTTYTWRDEEATEDGTLEALVVKVNPELRFDSYEMTFVGEEAAEETESTEDTTEESTDATESTEETVEEESTEESAE